MSPLPKLIAKALVSLLLLLSVAGCTTVESISVSQIPEKSQRTGMITAHAWSPIILLFSFGSGYVDSAREDLLAQCAGGAIEGMLAKTEVVDYFLGLYETQNVTLQGYCIHSRGKAAHGNHHRRDKGA